jgi:D-alanyl-D-alanine carboxypeptidase/D-alanyl-D-alanine-endopeptidase (penicillin-binding protein 4)
MGTTALVGALLAWPQPPTSARAAPAPSTDAPPAEATAPAAERPATLPEQIDALLSAPFLGRATIGMSVVDLKSGKVLFSRGDDLSLNPASNIKLVTTAAALAILGPEHRYATRVYGKKDGLSGGVLSGDLYLRGSGDPGLVTADLYEIANDLYSRGIRRIKGGIVVDSTLFDRDELPPGYDQQDELAHYRAPSGSTSVNFNTYVVRVRPGLEAAAPAVAAIDPPVRSISLKNRATTIDGHRNRVTVRVDPDDTKTAVTLSGNIGVRAGPAKFRFPIRDPSLYAGEVMRVVLRQRGIRVGKPTVKAGTIPKRAQLLGIHYSPALSVLARSINKISNNFMAEQVLKTLSEGDQPATFAGGLERVRAYLESIGMSMEGLKLGNGSGLYDTNRITAAQLTYLLGHAYEDFRYSSDFLASLSIMGVDGTARHRLGKSRAARYVRAKTGTLHSVSCLSGYAGRVGETPVAFSILMNDLEKWQIGAARGVQNQIAEAIAMVDSAGGSQPAKD